MMQLPISLPSGFTLLVKAGDKVSKGGVLAEKKATDEFRLNIAETFAIPIKNARLVLRKAPGDNVEAGELIALKKHLLGFRKKAIFSHIKGTISRFERDTGTLVITATDERVAGSIISPVEGIVTLCDNEKIVIASATQGVSGEKGAGTVGTGELFVLNDSFVQQVTDLKSNNLLYLLDSEAVGKIIIGGNFSREVLLKGIGIGVEGIIGTAIADEDLAYLGKRNQKTPVIQVTPEIAKKIIGWKGKKVSLDGESRTIMFLNA